MQQPIRWVYVVAALMMFVPGRARADVLYVSNFGAGTISKVDTTNGAVSTFVSGLDLPNGLAFDSAGNLYVVLSNQAVVDKISPAGVVTTFASNFPGYNLFGLAFDSSGNLYVAGIHATGTFLASIFELDPQGSLIRTLSWSPGGSGPLEPTNLAFDRNGNLFTTDYSGNAVYKITPAGVASKFTPLFVNPQGLAFDQQGNLFVSTNSSDEIREITPGGVVSTFAAGISNPTGVAFDTQGNLYVGNSLNGGTGTTLTKITPSGTASLFATGLNRPYDIAVRATDVPEPRLLGQLAFAILVIAIGRRSRLSESFELLRELVSRRA